jgi:hypothetical protein
MNKRDEWMSQDRVCCRFYALSVLGFRTLLTHVCVIKHLERITKLVLSKIKFLIGISGIFPPLCTDFIFRESTYSPSPSTLN